MLKKICVISEIESHHEDVPDEGARKFAVHFANELKRDNHVLAIQNRKATLAQKLLWDKKIQKQLTEFQPEILFLIPTNLKTIARIHLKYDILKFLKLKTKIVLFSFQPFRYHHILDRFLRYGLPDFILTQSPFESEKLGKLGIKSYLFPSGVDLNKFKPISKEGKILLRQKYNLLPERYIILHVGHLDRSRNVEILASIKNSIPNSDVLLIVPSSGHVTSSIAEKLKAAGVLLFQSYIESIEEIYQLSDCYVFPVEDRSGAVGFPLSVIDAMACNVPVVSTRFEALPYFIKGIEGFRFVNKGSEILANINEINKNSSAINVRTQAMNFDWPSISDKILNIIGNF